MPRNKNYKKARRRVPRRNNNQNFLLRYQPPVFRKMTEPSTMVTLRSTFALTSGVLGNNGNISTLNWNQFWDKNAFTYIYKYMEVSCWKLEFTLSQTTAALDSFTGCTMAFLPINYLIEGLPNTAPPGEYAVAALPGAITVQPGATNKGRWYRNEFKQVFSTSDIFAPSPARACGVIVWYADDVGISETIGTVNLMVNVRFYGQDYIATAPTFIEKRPPMKSLTSYEEIKELI